jgi:small nuclear ribonucleoprotein (snRNP)-like protein
MFRRTYLDRLVRSRVIAHTKDDQSIRGTLRSVDRDSVVLDPAEYLEPGAEDGKPLNGAAVILRQNVSWLQVRDAGT